MSTFLASETQTKVAAVRASLKQVEDHLAPLLKRGPGEVQRALTAVENAELNVALAFSVASLYFCHLHTTGVDPSSHPIKQELDRIQLYFKKLKGKVEEIRETEEAERQLRIDQDVAKRIVQHYVRAADAHKQRQRGSEKRSQTVAAESGEQETEKASVATNEPAEAEPSPTPKGDEEQKGDTVTSEPATDSAPKPTATESAPKPVSETESADVSLVTEKDSTSASVPEAVADAADKEVATSVPAALPPKAPPKKAPPPAPKKAPSAEPPEVVAPETSAEKRKAEDSAQGESPTKKPKKKVLVKVKAKAKGKAKAKADAT